jgi:hypothetical protein
VAHGKERGKTAREGEKAAQTVVFHFRIRQLGALSASAAAEGRDDEAVMLSFL